MLFSCRETFGFCWAYAAAKKTCWGFQSLWGSRQFLRHGCVNDSNCHTLWSPYWVVNVNSLNPSSKQEEFPKQVLLLVMQIIKKIHPSHWRNLTGNNKRQVLLKSWHREIWNTWLIIMTFLWQSALWTVYGKQYCSIHIISILWHLYVSILGTFPFSSYVLQW